MKVLIVGYGSIAKKHVAALKTLRPDCEIYTYKSKNSSGHLGITNIESLDEFSKFDFVIISNPTFLHKQALLEILPLNIPVFLEKPPFSDLLDIDAIVDNLKQRKILSYTAFNLRFLECLKYLKDHLEQDKINEVNIYCGSYLPDWRPGSNFRNSYSTKQEMGGGVHLDLIHELDYTLWLFGKPEKISSTLSSHSTLKIEAIDYAHYVLEYSRFTLTITLNYFRKDPVRTIEVVELDRTLKANLLTNSILEMSSQRTIFQSNKSTIDTYVAQMDYFLQMLSEGKMPDNNIENSILVLKYALQ